MIVWLTTLDHADEEGVADYDVYDDYDWYIDYDDYYDDDDDEYYDSYYDAYYDDDDSYIDSDYYDNEVPGYPDESDDYYDEGDDYDADDYACDCYDHSQGSNASSDAEPGDGRAPMQTMSSQYRFASASTDDQRTLATQNTVVITTEQALESLISRLTLDQRPQNTNG